MNLPNKLTLFRVLLVPIFAALLLIGEIPFGKPLALFVFALASLTDLLDGKIARKYNLITDFGKFLDPLADKILAVSAFVCFVELGWGMPGWALMVIIAREFAVSGIRLLAVNSPQKTVIGADFPGKLKTAFSLAAIVIILFARCLADAGILSAESAYFAAYPLSVITAALTVWSGALYIWKYRKLFLNSK